MNRGEAQLKAAQKSGLILIMLQSAMMIHCMRSGTFSQAILHRQKT